MLSHKDGGACSLGNIRLVIKKPVSVSLFRVCCLVASKMLGAENAFCPAAWQRPLTAGNPSYRRCLLISFLQPVFWPCLSSLVLPMTAHHDRLHIRLFWTWVLQAGCWQRTRPRGWPRKQGELAGRGEDLWTSCHPGFHWDLSRGDKGSLEEPADAGEHTSLHSQTRHWKPEGRWETPILI